MKRMLKNVVAAFVIVLGASSPAWAEMPQTDVQLVEAMAGQSGDKVLVALELYYALHVSEIEVQLTKEQNTGAFFAARRAEGDGDKAEAQRQMEAFEGTKATLAAAKQANQDLRQKLSAITAMAFADDLSMAPGAPDALPAAPAGAPAAFITARGAAWAAIEAARAHWSEVRLQLLEDQERYDKTRDVKIGNSMRAMTQAEVALTRATCTFRLVEARLAAATGMPLGEALGAGLLGK